MSPASANDSGVSKQARSRLPWGIWALGLVSMFMDISSEMIHGLLPVFLSSVLGASTVTIGAIEGIGEATASVCKLLSGWLSDRLRRRKALAVFGYGLSALTKPLFAMAPSAGWVLAARFSDRVGKGVRGAPRDALVAEIAPPALRGAAYGLRQSLDTVGAFAGPALAIALMTLFDNDFRAVFWVAVIPGLVAVVLLALGVEEPAHGGEGRAGDDARPPIRWAELGELGGLFWAVVAVGAVLTLARFSEAFLVLRARDAGLPAAMAPLTLVAMNVVYALSAYPMGALSDRLGRGGLIAAGFGVLIVADLVLAMAGSVPSVLFGVALWGLHLGMTQGLLAALVADAVAERRRATAFGVFHFVGGMALLLASLLAGILWERLGAPATFLAGAGFTAAGLAGAVGLSSVSRRRGGDS